MTDITDNIKLDQHDYDLIITALRTHYSQNMKKLIQPQDSELMSLIEDDVSTLIGKIMILKAHIPAKERIQIGAELP